MRILRLYPSLLKQYKPNLIVSHLRVCLNQWSTPRRLWSSQIDCPFKCGSSDDSIEHCLTCERLQKNINEHFHGENLLFTMANLIYLKYGDDESEETAAFLILYIHVAFIAYNHARHGHRLSPRLIEYILKAVCKHCPRMRKKIIQWRTRGVFEH